MIRKVLYCDISLQVNTDFSKQMPLETALQVLEVIGGFAELSGSKVEALARTLASLEVFLKLPNKLPRIQASYKDYIVSRDLDRAVKRQYNEEIRVVATPATVSPRILYVSSGQWRWLLGEGRVL